MFKRAVISGEGGMRKWACKGLKVFSWGCRVYCFLLGGKLPMICISILFSMPKILHYKWRGAGRRARATVCWGWDGVTGNVSGEESPWLLSSLNCVIKYHFRETRVWNSSRRECIEQDSRNSLASFRSWVTWSVVSPGLSQVPPLSGGFPPSYQSLAAYGGRSRPGKCCREALWCGRWREWAYKY